MFDRHVKQFDIQYWQTFPKTAIPLQLLWQTDPSKNNPPEQPVQLDDPELKHEEHGFVQGRQFIPEL